MTYHVWGDSWFKKNENTLYNAMDWIIKLYRRKTKQNMMIKEKYGTVRYEYTYLWIMTGKDTLIWLEILRRATIKFPKVAAELVDDVIPIINTCNKKTAWYKGYFEGINWGQRRSRWISMGDIDND